MTKQNYCVSTHASAASSSNCSWTQFSDEASCGKLSSSFIYSLIQTFTLSPPLAAVEGKLWMFFSSQRSCRFFSSTISLCLPVYFESSDVCFLSVAQDTETLRLSSVHMSLHHVTFHMKPCAREDFVVNVQHKQEVTRGVSPAHFDLFKSDLNKNIRVKWKQNKTVSTSCCSFL